MTGNMEGWFAGGVILYTETNKTPRIKIITRDHTYEMQASKFDPMMQMFSVLVDGKFYASKYDSLDRLIKLDEASKSGQCSEREEILYKENMKLNQEIQNLKDIIENMKKECDGLRLVIINGDKYGVSGD